MSYFSLYKIGEIEPNDKTISSEIVINHNDSLFDGHFPNVKILPGVGYLSVITQILSESLEMSWISKELRQAKFLKPLILTQDERIDALLTLARAEKSQGKTCLKVKAVFQQGQTIFSKINGLWISTDSPNRTYLNLFS